MGREQLDLAQGRDPQLHARAAELDPRDPFLDHTALPGEACRGRRRAPGPPSPTTSPSPAARARPLRPAPPVPEDRSGRRVAFPAPATPSLSFTIADRIDWLRAPQRGERRLDLLAELRRSSAPRGVRDALLAKQLPAAGLGPEDEQTRVGAVHRYPEREGEVSLLGRGRVGHQVAESSDPGSGRGCRSISCGRSSSLRRERDRREPSLALATSAAAPARGAGITPGSSPR